MDHRDQHRSCHVFLVHLRDTSEGRAVFGSDHEPFIDELIAANVVLLGGPFGYSPSSGVRAAYVLRCETFEEAQRSLRAIRPSRPAALSRPYRRGIW